MYNWAVLNENNEVTNWYSCVTQQKVDIQIPDDIDLNNIIGMVWNGSEFVEKSKTVDELKVEKLDELKDYVNNQKTLMESKYSDITIGSFEDKRKEALAWKIDSTAVTPYVDMLCTKADGTVDANYRALLLDAILAKVTGVAQLEAYEDVTRTAINTCTTQAELDAIIIG